MTTNILTLDWEIIKELVEENPNDTKLGEEVRKMYNKFERPIIVDDAGCDVETGKFLG